MAINLSFTTTHSDPSLRLPSTQDHHPRQTSDPRNIRTSKTTGMCFEARVPRYAFLMNSSSDLGILARLELVEGRLRRSERRAQLHKLGWIVLAIALASVYWASVRMWFKRNHNQVRGSECAN